MDSYDAKQLLLNNLEDARIYAGAEMESLANEKEYIDALIFQSIRDNTAESIQLLKDYIAVKESEEQNE